MCVFVYFLKAFLDFSLTKQEDDDKHVTIFWFPLNLFVVWFIPILPKNQELDVNKLYPRPAYTV